MKDKLQNDINAGDMIAYATKNYRSPTMRIGNVKSVSPGHVSVLGQGMSSCGTLTEGGRIINLTALGVTVAHI